MNHFRVTFFSSARPNSGSPERKKATGVAVNTELCESVTAVFLSCLPLVSTAMMRTMNKNNLWSKCFIHLTDLKAQSIERNPGRNPGAGTEADAMKE